MVSRQTRLLVSLLSVLAAVAGCTDRRHDAVLVPLAEASSAARPAQGGSEVGSQATPKSSAPQVLGVPRARAPIKPTGRFNVKTWGQAANTHTLLDRDGHGAVPVSEARFLWGDGQLYVFFYAGDLDLQVRATKRDQAVWKDDSVALAFFSANGKERIIQISPKGVVADGICPEAASDLGDPRCDLKWQSGVRAAADYDGTINKVGDFDEEWAVEAVVPLASVAVDNAGPGARVPFRISRCEVAYNGVRSCGSWGGAPGGGILVFEDR